MLGLAPLQSLYGMHIEESSPYFEQMVERFLSVPTTVLPPDILEECVWQEPLLSEERIAANWQRLLAFNILCHTAQTSAVKRAEKVRSFGRHPWNQNSQYLRALVALNHALAEMPVPEVGCQLLEQGAALIDLQEYCPWLALPFTPQHFELGLCLGLLALVTQRDDLKEPVSRLAHWQLNTLDASAKPLTGLFAREKEGQRLHHLCVSYLLFRSAAILTQKQIFATVAAASAVHLAQEAESGGKIAPLWPLIEKWLESYEAPPEGPLALSDTVYDPSTALVGHRSPDQHVFCTLHGSHTGLGTLRLGDIEIVSYGPQYLPLGECQGFGIEGNAYSDQGIRQTLIASRPGSFSIAGCTRMVDQPASALSTGRFRGIWMEVSQEFKPPCFTLNTHWLGLDGWEGVAFSFFVTAPRCRLQSRAYLVPRTLQRYTGANQSVVFEGSRGLLELKAPAFPGTMEVIPLAGGNNFWGADFLVAYYLHSDERHYEWHMLMQPASATI